MWKQDYALVSLNHCSELNLRALAARERARKSLSDASVKSCRQAVILRAEVVRISAADVSPSSEDLCWSTLNDI